MPRSRTPTRRSPRNAPRSRRAALAAALLCLVGCQNELESLDWPWSDAPPRRGAAASEPLDCDDVPALSAEERARPPREPSLGKSAPAEPAAPPPFTTLPGVSLSSHVATKVAQIDKAYFAAAGTHLVITSGTRDAASQAKAMYKMITLGADIVRLYRNKAAAAEIQEAYDGAAGKPPDEIVTAMYDVIRAQIERDVFISAHLRAGAVDIRNRTMSAAQKSAFRASAAKVDGVRVLEESKPPHYHLQID